MKYFILFMCLLPLTAAWFFGKEPETHSKFYIASHIFAVKELIQVEIEMIPCLWNELLDQVKMVFEKWWQDVRIWKIFITW